ncbi:MAG TPA: class I SAM-dependent methyltransferase, partial [Syntrophomonadaceae bacterium]|nr:class I SAM-dependent methyltransferase [Syntrophomonadaceae bacterium]
AYIRGYHALHDDPKIFDDALAYRLVPEQVREEIEKALAATAAQMAPEEAKFCTDYAAALLLGIRTMAGPMLARARYVEDLLEEAVNKGVSQYVILGAGLDTFAFRRLDLIDNLQVFEIDHPATQVIKRQLLAHLGLKEPECLHFIAVDFAQESLASALARSSYNPQSPSFFSWMGVVHYLPLEAIHATLGDMVKNACFGSGIVFDYWDKLAFDPERASNRVKTIMDGTKKIGEPIITGFDPSTLAEELARLGLRQVENLAPAEIQERFLQGCSAGYSVNEHVHYTYAVVI